MRVSGSVRLACSGDSAFRDFDWDNCLLAGEEAQRGVRVIAKPTGDSC